MRRSKKDDILQAARDIVQRDGVTSLTYEAVAQESGLTKGGLLYHFPSREALLLGLHQYVADQWEETLERDGGGTAQELTEQQRFAAYARASESPDRVELGLMLEASGDPMMYKPWGQVLNRWSSEPPTTVEPETDETLDAFVARLAADGLWFYEALSPEGLAPKVRQELIERIVRLAEESSR